MLESQQPAAAGACLWPRDKAGKAGGALTMDGDVGDSVLGGSTAIKLGYGNATSSGSEEASTKDAGTLGGGMSGGAVTIDGGQQR